MLLTETLQLVREDGQEKEYELKEAISVCRLCIWAVHMHLGAFKLTQKVSFVVPCPPNISALRLR